MDLVAGVEMVDGAIPAGDILVEDGEDMEDTETTQPEQADGVDLGEDGHTHQTQQQQDVKITNPIIYL